MTPTQFAKLILEAQRIREESYIDLGSLEANASRTEYASYALDHNQAAEKACNDASVHQDWAYPIYLLNACAWNDIQAWAEDKPE